MLMLMLVLQAATGPTLWTTTRAGMSVHELVAARPNAVDTSPEARARGAECVKEESGIQIEELVFRACYRFDAAGLAKVHLSNSTASSFHAQRFQNKLSGKYGQPVSSSIDRLLGNRQTVVWRTPEGVRVTYEFWNPDVVKGFLSIDYETSPDNL